MTEDEACTILEVSPEVSHDEKRRAYLRKLKHTKPENDPEGFQRLREAWEVCQEWEAAAPARPPAMRREGYSPQPRPEVPVEVEVPVRATPVLDERQQLMEQLQAGSCDAELLMSTMDRLLLEYDPWHPHANDDLLEAFNEGLSRATERDDRLTSKWALADQIFSMGLQLSTEAVEALKLVVIHLEQPIPENDLPRLSGLADPSVSRLYKLKSPFLARYIDSREDLRALRPRSLKMDFVREAASKDSGKSVYWIVALAIAGVLVTIRVLSGISDEPRPTANPMSAINTALVKQFSHYVPNITEDMLEAMHPQEVARLERQIGQAVEMFSRPLPPNNGLPDTDNQTAWTRLKDEALSAQRTVAQWKKKHLTQEAP